jgi:quercetin dioxygenase-like cupin family protein
MEEVLGPEELADKAAAFALGALDPVEAGSFGRTVSQDAAVAAEVDSYRLVAEALALNVPLAAPPAGLRQQLLSNLGEQDTVAADATVAVADRWVVRAGEGNWHPMEPGVEVKVLYKDFTRHTITTLVKMDAGAKIPRHYHDGGEECYVISGDIYDDHISMKAGDYISLMRDTMHSFVSTINGALLLIISPLGHDGAVTV